MGALPTPIRLDVKATGNSADGQIHRNAVDDAFGAMAPKLLLFMRADTLAYSSSSVTDSLGNPLSNAAHSALTKTTSDSNFNGNPSLTFSSSVTNPFVATAGDIGSTLPPVAMTNSFTLVCGLYLPSSLGSNQPTLFGDNATTNGTANSTGLYIKNNGHLGYGMGGSDFNDTGYAPFALGSAGVLWVSYDASAGILRAGANNANVGYQVSPTYKRTGAGTSTVVYPFGYDTSSSSGATHSWHRWALFNKAFLNGAVAADDAQFAALVSLYGNLI